MSDVSGAHTMTMPILGGISPFFIVADMTTSLAFYRDTLGFEITYVAESPDDPYFAIVERDRVMIMLKAVSAAPQPNPKRDAQAPWDAYVYVPDPDALAAEFSGRGVTFTKPLRDTHDGLRGFELADPNGYVLFFGRPRPS